MRDRVVDIGKLLLFPMKDAFSRLLRVRTQYLPWIFTTVVITILAFPPPSLRVTRLVDLHASASSVVAVSSGIQVRVFVECISATKIND
jgi:hypothetical protein